MPLAVRDGSLVWNLPRGHTRIKAAPSCQYLHHTLSSYLSCKKYLSIVTKKNIFQKKTTFFFFSLFIFNKGKQLAIPCICLFFLFLNIVLSNILGVCLEMLAAFFLDEICRAF